MSRNILVRFWHFPVVTLGPGRRLGIWLQGCSIHCKGCIAPENQPFDEEFSVPLETLIYEITPALNEASGITISGGEPLDQSDILIDFLTEIKRLGIDDILLYSGYEKDKILSEYPKLSGLIAALIDGQFVEGAATDAVWKGSENQTLTIFNEKYREKYESWSALKKRDFQLIKNETAYYLLGIPNQNENWKEKILNSIGLEV